LRLGRLTLATFALFDRETYALLADPKRKRKRQMVFPWEGLT
jgi:hypothetical protein